MTFSKCAGTNVNALITFNKISLVQECRGLYGYHILIRTEDGDFKISEYLMKGTEYTEFGNLIANKSKEYASISSANSDANAIITPRIRIIRIIRIIKKVYDHKITNMILIVVVMIVVFVLFKKREMESDLLDKRCGDSYSCRLFYSK